MLLVSVTLDTSQFEMAPLKDVADENITVIVVMLDMSHFESSPLGLGQRVGNSHEQS